MTFLNPILALVGLACVGLPILIHILMRRRRKPVAWAAMRFLLEAYQQQRRRLRFEQFLLLAARCLIVALIAVGLGRPVLGRLMGSAVAGPTTLYLVIDDSVASSTQGEGTEPAIERHKAEALRLLDELDGAAGDRAALVTLGAPARAVVLPPTSDLVALRTLVRELKPSDSAGDLAGALALVAPAGSDQDRGRRALAVLSDFRAGSLAAGDAPASPGASPTGARATQTGIAIFASEPAAAALSNTAITAVEPLRPVVIATPRGGASALGQAPVRVAMKRSGELPAASTAVRLALVVDTPSAPRRVAAGQGLVRWAAGQTDATTTIALDPAALLSGSGSSGGGVVLAAEIDADAVAADNTFTRPIEVRRALRVGLVATRGSSGARGVEQFDTGDWIRLSLATADNEIELVDVDPSTLDASRLAALDAAVLLRPDALPSESWKRLATFVATGGLLVVAPPQAIAVGTWPDALTRELGVPWVLPREPSRLDATITDQGRSVEPADDLLALLAPELGELGRAVRITRALAPESAPRGQTLLALSGGTPLLLVARPGTASAAGSSAGASTTSTSAGSGAPAPDAASPSRGLVVLMTVAPSLDWTDLPAKPLMVPLMQEIIRQGVGRARGVWTTLAGRSPDLPPRSVELRPQPDSTREDQPSAIRVADGARVPPLRRAGVYRALDDRGSVRGLVAVNADAAGARVDTQPRTAVAAALASVGGEVAWITPDARVRARGDTSEATSSARTLALGAPETGMSRLVFWILVAAIGVGVLELAMARWFGHATVRRSLPGTALSDTTPRAEHAA